MRFSPMPSATYEPCKNIRVEQEWHWDRRHSSTIDESIIVQAAWAIVVARYSNSHDVVFGFTDAVGPADIAAPVRVKLVDQEAVIQLMQRMQRESTRSVPSDGMCLSQNNSSGLTRGEACSSNNRQLIGIPGIVRRLDLQAWGRVDCEVNGRQEVQHCAVKIVCVLDGTKVKIEAVHESHTMAELEVLRLVHQFSHILDQMINGPENTLVGAIDMLSPHDFAEVRQWNNGTIESVEDSIPSIFSSAVRKYPWAPAICSWDGKYSYSELDNVTTKLAWHLRNLGVGAEVIVPVCFDKSALAVVAMIGILKAGGAYVALEPDHPDARLTSIINDVEAKLIISAPQHAERFSELVTNVISVCPTFFESLSQLPSAKLPEISPTSSAVVVFTSGSTGKPKGIVVEHRNLCSTSAAAASKCAIGYGSRIFQFAAYIFDVSIGDIFTSLTSGACICIPSPDDRRDKIDIAINQLDANVAFLTPTVASLLMPEDVPGLQRLILSGEAITEENVRDWADKVKLQFFYGPAETTVHCSGTQPVQPEADPANLGHAHAAKLWIVDRSDHNKLAPVGCVGEILVEGPLVARGYHQDSEKTVAAFVENLSWASDRRSGERRRYYKTGDLARYTPTTDGTMCFVARKDNQVKVRGQRIELAEIEHHLYGYEQVRHVVALLPESGPFKGRLVAMLAMRDGVSLDGDASRSHQVKQKICIQTRLPQNGMSPLTGQIEDYLIGRLPCYMVPSAFVFVNAIPLNTSGKLFRQEVKAWFERMDYTTHQLVKQCARRL